MQSIGRKRVELPAEACVEGHGAHYGIIAVAVLEDELRPWMERRQWSLDKAALERLEILLEHWQRYGAVMNLSGDLRREALVAQVQDGLDTAHLVRSHVELGAQTRWVDVGSGGGFPGLVLGAVLPVQLVLVEPRQKRVAFLQLAIGAIGVSSVDVRRGRLERDTWNEEALNGDIDGQMYGFDVGSARAVWDPKEWKIRAKNVVKEGGHVVMHLSSDSSAAKGAFEASLEGERGTIALIRR